MLFDDWTAFSRYQALMPEVAAAIADFQKRAATLANGTYPLHGDLAKASVFDSKTTPELGLAVWEIHREYADLQTILDGEEVNYCRPHVEGLVPKMDFNEKDDYQLFQPADTDRALRLLLTSRNFAVYFPGEAHITSFTLEPGTSRPLRKIVFKIHRSLFR